MFPPQPRGNPAAGMRQKGRRAMKMKSAKFLGAILALIFAGFVPAHSAACERDCRLTAPAVPVYKGDRKVKTIPVRICLTDDHWDGIGRTWWGEALADTGQPAIRWLKMPAVKAQCHTRFVVAGARVGTKLDCRKHRGWVWTEPMRKSGTYYMSLVGVKTAPKPAN